MKINGLGRAGPDRTVHIDRQPNVLVREGEYGTMSRDGAFFGRHRSARWKPHMQVIQIDAKHFDPYFDPLFPEVLAHQLKFLLR